MQDDPRNNAQAAQEIMPVGCSQSNAVPEWQAGSMWWRSRELKAACPLEGLFEVAPLLENSHSVKNNPYEERSPRVIDSCLSTGIIQKSLAGINGKSEWLYRN
jgi:hypothetical protein